MSARIPSIHTCESCTVRRRAPQLDVRESSRVIFWSDAVGRHAARRVTHMNPAAAHGAFHDGPQSCGERVSEKYPMFWGVIFLDQHVHTKHLEFARHFVPLEGNQSRLRHAAACAPGNY